MNHKSIVFLFFGLIALPGTTLGDKAPKSTLADNNMQKLRFSKQQFGGNSERLTYTGELRAGDTQLMDGSLADTYPIALGAGDELNITLSSRDFDTFLMIFRRAADGEIELLAENDDAGGTLNSALTFRAPAAGTYLLVSNGVGPSDVGDYELVVNLTRAQGNVAMPAGSGRVSLGETYTGRLSANEDDRLADGTLFEVVAFTGERGQRVIVELVSQDFDPVLGLGIMHEGEQRILVFNDDFDGSTDSRVMLELPLSGDYFLLVTSYADRSGAYSLQLREQTQAERAAPLPNFSRNGDPSERYALLVGIDDYPGVRDDLGSCVVDTQEMRELLVEQFGFDRDNILILNDNEASKDNVVRAIREFLGQVGPAGSATFYFSGHGTQVEDEGSDEDDGKDEALYCWGSNDKSSYLRDDELGALLSELNGDRILAVLDACYSGTGTLGGLRVKAVDLDRPWIRERLATPTDIISSSVQPADTKRASSIDGPEDHILWAACRPDQVAQAGSGGQPSVFTYFLIQEIRRNGTNRSMASLFDALQSQVVEHLREVLRTDDQRLLQQPQVEGPKLQRTLAQVLGA